MSKLVLFNKPYGVICQFSGAEERATLKHHIAIPGIYPAGRLDTDSEGLLLLTDNGRWQHEISHPLHKLWKTYWVQVEGEPTSAQLAELAAGVVLSDVRCQPCRVCHMDEPTGLWPRTPPIRSRQTVPTSWLELQINEGKNRQVRRMTAKVGLPTLRLIRSAIGSWQLDGLATGEYRQYQYPEQSSLETIASEYSKNV